MATIEQKSLVNFLKEQGIQDERVLQAMLNIPRTSFVQNAFAHRCYDNVALPIGEGQTISQPYIVARMTELLELKADDKVLEIGTGCGYQTAILASIVDFVYSIERIKKLQWGAFNRLKSLDIYNTQLIHGDGWQGWQGKAPFDAIIVTAAPTSIPVALLHQLADEGRMVLPIGDKDGQILQKIIRYGDKYQVEEVEHVKFVPLVKGDLK